MHIARLRKPSVEHAQATPSRLYIGLAAKGKMVPKELREHDAAAIALAAKISYASTR